MTRSFRYAGSPAQIVFAPGAIEETGRWIGKLGCRRALVLSTPHQKADAEALSARLGDLSVGIFAQAAMHTPVEVTARAIVHAADVAADCIVSLGGGSTTGLGKAIALNSDLPQIVIPTTYAGSEATPILGQTENGVKTTLRDAKVLPEIVIYDPNLTLGLPVAMSVASGLNAMAHAVEALYAEDRNPISSLMAAEGLRAMVSALPAIVGDPADRAARAEALYGAWLCGTVLGTVGMALHHKICHTLGGSFDLPHAETHAVMLPHTVAYNAQAIPDLLKPLQDLFKAPPGAGLHAFALSLGAPTALKDFGLQESDLDRAADLATKNSYPNPRPVDRQAIRAMLQNALDGRPPEN